MKIPEQQLRPSCQPEIAAVDLFCGAGGLTHGLIQSGIKVVAGIDNDDACKFAYERNNRGAVFMCRDVASIDCGELELIWGNAPFRLLAGCAPCQPFSTYRQGRNPREDDRFPLLRHFERLITGTLPDFVTMENVPNVKLYSVFERFTQTLKALDYSVTARVIDCTELGIPQHRKRMVLIGSRHGDAPEFSIPPTRVPTVREAFARLPSLQNGSQSKSDRLHRCAKLTPINLKRIRASRPGGSWKDWPDDLRAECHKRESGDGYGAVYGRLRWDAAAPTVTTQCYNYGSGRFGHPEEDRTISMREAASLQSFPRSYQFDSGASPLPLSTIARLIGNAVPVKLGEMVGTTLTDHQEKHGKTNVESPARCCSRTRD